MTRAKRIRSPEAIAKGVATRRANREARLTAAGGAAPAERVKDALVYLRKARATSDHAVANALTDLAIFTLQGRL